MHLTNNPDPAPRRSKSYSSTPPPATTPLSTHEITQKLQATQERGIISAQITTALARYYDGQGESELTKRLRGMQERGEVCRYMGQAGDKGGWREREELVSMVHGIGDVEAKKRDVVSAAKRREKGKGKAIQQDPVSTVTVKQEEI